MKYLGATEGLTLRCSSLFCLTWNSGMLQAELTIHRCLWQNIMVETYNRLPKAQKEKLKEILWEIMIFNNIYLYRGIQENTCILREMCTQRPEQTLRCPLGLIPRLSGSHWLSVRIPSRVNQQRLEEVFDLICFLFVYCGVFVFVFKLLAFKEISVKLLAEHDLKKQKLQGLHMKRNTVFLLKKFGRVTK